MLTKFAKSSRRGLLEVLFILLVLAITLPVGLYALNQSPRPNTESYGLAPDWFLPSVLLAAGHGFAVPLDVPEDSPLMAFIRQERLTLDPQDIPDGIPTGKAAGPVALHRYLYYVIGLIWWVFGISWPILKVLAAGLFICITLLIYGVFRLAAPRSIAAAGAIIFACHPVFLERLLTLKESSKAPFMLAALGLFGLIVRGHRSYRSVLVTAAMAGAVLGLGLGFRYDIIVCLPPGLFLLLAAQWPHEGLAIIKRLTAAGLALAVFFVCGFPILTSESSRGTHDHVVGGFAPDLEDRMNLEVGSYNRIQMNDDRLTLAMVNHYARNIMGRSAHVPFLSQEGDLPGRRYLATLLTTFPADALTRGYASTLTILQTSPTRRPPPDNGFVQTVHTLTAPLDRHLYTFGPVYAALALALLASRSLRRAWLLLLLIIYFGAYPNIQFYPRHYFHLTFFSLWCMAFVWYQVIRSIVHALRRNDEAQEAPADSFRDKTKRVALFLVSALLLLSIPLHASRLWQHKMVMNTVRGLDTAPLKPLKAERTTYEGSITLVAEDGAYLFRTEQQTDLTEGDPETGQPFIHTRYLVALLEAAPHARLMTIKYLDENWVHGFTRNINIPAHADTGPIKVFFPVHEFPESLGLGFGANTFDGVVLGMDDAEGFQGLYEVEDLSAFPMLLELTMAPGGRGFKWCEHLEWHPEE